MVKKETHTYIKGRVARILLNHPRGSLTKYKVAKLAESSYAWIYKILKKLEGDGMIKNTKVVDFNGLMSWWIKWQPVPKYRAYAVQMPLQLLTETDLEYVLTTYQAENKIQNYLFPSRTDIYVHAEDKMLWHKLMADNGLVGGGNVRVWVGDDHVFYNSFERSGLRLASIPQITMDLFGEKVAGVEAAEMLLEKIKKDALRKL